LGKTVSCAHAPRPGGSALVDGKAYLFVGFPPPNALTPILDVYDPATDTWTRAADMPTPRSQLASGAVNGRIYAISGISGGDKRTAEIYDPAVDEWQTGPSFPRPQHDHTAVSVADRIYVLGGSAGDVWEYDPAR
jgi:N-acetylneuraminic acid mutarotase